jgi:hypothetical protein
VVVTVRDGALAFDKRGTAADVIAKGAARRKA